MTLVLGLIFFKSFRAPQWVVAFFFSKSPAFARSKEPVHTEAIIFTFFLIFKFQFSILISSILAISLFLGDIFFSYIKRKNSLKDFSNFLQGHGGVLDRLDSMFFFVVIVNFLWNQEF